LKTDKYLIWSRAKENFFKSSKISKADKKSKAIKDVTANPFLLKNCGVFKDDRKVVSIALKGNGTCLRYASDRLKDDKRMVRLALRHRGESLKYASDRLKNDSTIVWEALNRHPSSITYASKRFRNKSKDLMGILFRYPECYEFLNSNLQSNFSVQLQTIKGTKKAYINLNLSRGCESLLAKNLIVSMHDNNHVLTALKIMNNCHPSGGISMRSLFQRTKGLGIRKFKKWVGRWSDDEDIMITLIKQDPINFSLASENLKADQDIFSIALDESLGGRYETYSPFKDAPKEFCDSRDLAIRASSKDHSYSYKYLSTRLRGDEEIASRYFGSIRAWQDLSPVPYSIRNQPKFIHWALRLGRLKVNSNFRAQLLLKRGADPIEIFNYSCDYIRSLEIIYIPAINLRPDIVGYLNDVKMLLEFDYTKLSVRARKILFERYRYLQGKFKTTEVDLFNRAAEEIRVKKIMCINPIS
jgi:hypothetical protein